MIEQLPKVIKFITDVAAEFWDNRVNRRGDNPKWKVDNDHEAFLTINLLIIVTTATSGDERNCYIYVVVDDDD